ncbi:MAG: radical SAM protein, partial [Actinobacteria bacterium]|nr:radical SAM protein [Actinomycetota bacterium]
MTSPREAGLRPSDVLASFDGPLGAYVHIPFCEWICPFCPYNKVLARPDLAADYFAALRAEILMYQAGPFTSLYVGGGTPTLYPQHLAEIVPRIPVTGERAIEVLPLHGTAERLSELKDIGFTAVSIGAQSFHDPVLRHLHRPHDASQARAAVHNALDTFDCV